MKDIAKHDLDLLERITLHQQSLMDHIVALRTFELQVRAAISVKQRGAALRDAGPLLDSFSFLDCAVYNTKQSYVEMRDIAKDMEL